MSLTFSHTHIPFAVNSGAVPRPAPALSHTQRRHPRRVSILCRTLAAAVSPVRTKHKPSPQGNVKKFLCILLRFFHPIASILVICEYPPPPFFPIRMGKSLPFVAFLTIFAIKKTAAFRCRPFVRIAAGYAGSDENSASIRTRSSAVGLPLMIKYKMPYPVSASSTMQSQTVQLTAK